MKLVNALLVLMFAALGGCGGSSSPDDGVVSVSCANVSNDAPACGSAAVTTNSGSVSRDNAMWISGTVTNNTGTTFQLYLEYRMNPGCNGEVNWLAGSSTGPIPAGGSIAPAMSRQCSAMPLGPASMSFIVYQGPATTVCQKPEEIDPAIGQQCTTTHGAEIDRGTATYTVTP